VVWEQLCLHIDYCTHSHASGLLGIVFDFMQGTGGVIVCCEHSVITHDGSRNPYYVPMDKYVVVATPDQNLHILPELQAVHNMVFTGTLNPNIQKHISYSK
jgi:hypothetical protein